MNIGKIIQAVIGVLVVLVLAIVVYGWYGDFKSAPPAAAPSAVGTSTPPSVISTGSVVIGIAKIEGVNFRVKPASNAKLIRGLHKNEKVTILAKDGQWYKVKDSRGRLGWVTANGDYVVVQSR